MCGNFGLVIVQPRNDSNSNVNYDYDFGVQSNLPGLDESIQRSMDEVRRANGLLLAGDIAISSHGNISNVSEVAIDAVAMNYAQYDTMRPLVTPSKILQEQTACTEVRGGQAGGISSLDYLNVQSDSTSGFDAQFRKIPIATVEPIHSRVRLVARKRIPLAQELAELYTADYLAQYNIALDRKKLLWSCGNQSTAESLAYSAIGHTRFATSSINIEPELHPHEWVPFHYEYVWKFNAHSGRMERFLSDVGIHITHNGDFDALAAYGGMMVNEEVGWWLERVLHCSNDNDGDSPKIAGFMDLSRVQGRWAAAARLAYIRCICKNNVDEVTGFDATGGSIPLSKRAPNIFPVPEYWEAWGEYFESVWVEHINNIIRRVGAENRGVPLNGIQENQECEYEGTSEDIMDEGGGYRYRVDKSGFNQFLSVLETTLSRMDYDAWVANVEGTAADTGNENLSVLSQMGLDTSTHSALSNSVHNNRNANVFRRPHSDVGGSSHGAGFNNQSLLEPPSALSAATTNTGAVNPTKMLYFLDANHWSAKELKSFIYATVRGFLFADTYTVVTEFISRAEGSFGLQVHCSMEPGVVVVASKGQPMSLAFDPQYPVALCASEAEAVAVPITEDGEKWCKYRLDLDSNGEIVRFGLPKTFLDGSFHKYAPTTSSSGNVGAGASGISFTPKNSRLFLSAVNIEIKSYSTCTNCEASAENIIKRSIVIGTSASTAISHSSVPNGPAISNTSHHGMKISEHGVKNSRHGMKNGSQHGMKISEHGVKNSRHGVKNGSEHGMKISKHGVKNSYPGNGNVDEYGTKGGTSAGTDCTHPVDSVASDLSSIPAVIAAIDRAWLRTNSPEHLAGNDLALCLGKSMRDRLARNDDSIDFLIAGVEISLWVAEQFASDLRLIFPQLNVTTMSSNKLLSYLPPTTISSSGDDRDSHAGYSKVPYFSGVENISPRKVNRSTCIMLISQSGQTFGTLHATRTLLSYHNSIDIDKVWIVTGCFNSKMELALTEAHEKHKDKAISSVNFKNPRVFNNYSGNRPAEPATVAVVAVYHTLTRMLLHIVDVIRKRHPSGRVLHRWAYEKAARVVLAFYRKHRGNITKSRRKYMKRESEPAVASDNSDNLCFDKARLSSNSNPTLDQIVMQVSDGCVADMNAMLLTSLIPNMCAIVGVDSHGQPLESESALDNHSAHGMRASNHGQPTVLSGGDGAKMNSLNEDLTLQGKRLGHYLTESYRMQYICSAYIVIAVGFGLPIVGTLASIVLAIYNAASGDGHNSNLIQFSIRNVILLQEQPIAYSLLGLLVQILDALLLIYCMGYVVAFFRIRDNIPVFNRLGNRTLVIVDSPCIHQMLESYVSKLFSQSFGYCSIEVHGASGIDHFVHRFTHRVTRGVLLAVGRCDGRLCCLAKNEACTLLAAKQAAFIQNPFYNKDIDVGAGKRSFVHELYMKYCSVVRWLFGKSESTVTLGAYSHSTVGIGHGPEFVTVGHNPYIPNLGDSATHIVLPSYGSRRKFVDEYIYERLFLAEKPFAGLILRRLSIDLKAQLQKRGQDSGLKAKGERKLPYGSHHIDPKRYLFPDFVLHYRDILRKKLISNAQIGPDADDGIVGASPHPYMHLQTWKSSNSLSVSAGAVPGDQNIVEKRVATSNNPGVRVAFSHKLDPETQSIQDRQYVVQYFYENRIASLERYVSFCVMFHSMAVTAAAPKSYDVLGIHGLFHWLGLVDLPPPLWDIARSQSNLRIATTASPIPKPQPMNTNTLSVESKAFVHEFVKKLRNNCEYFF